MPGPINSHRRRSAAEPSASLGYHSSGTETTRPSVSSTIKAWSVTRTAHGREIFYLSTDNKMMAVAVDTARGFSAGRPVALFDASQYFFGGGGRNFDVTADGKRFVMVKSPTAAPGRPPSITVVIDWADELHARVK